MRFDYNAMIGGLFFPLLLWTGLVIFVTYTGYPGVACMTPLAWLLSLPVGLRIKRESTSLAYRPVLEAAIAGAILGFWQGALFAAAMAHSRYLPGYTNDLPNPYLVGFIAILISVPVCTVVAAWIAWVTRA